MATLYNVFSKNNPFSVTMKDENTPNLSDFATLRHFSNNFNNVYFSCKRKFIYHLL